MTDTRPEGAALVVRAGQGGELASRFESDGLVAVGWPKLDDLSGIADRAELRALLESSHAADDVKRSVLELGDFLFSLVPGATVVTYNARDRYYLVGTVAGDYEYRPDLDLKTSVEPFKHIRRVEWRRGADRDSLSDKAKAKFPPYQTTFWLDEETLAEVAGDAVGAGPSYWWVCQGSSWSRARLGGYLWAPKQNEKGQTREFWTNLTKVRLGDIVFHYADKNVRAVGRVTKTAQDSPAPDVKDAAWRDDGWIVEVQMDEIDPMILLHDIPSSLRNVEAGPFDRNGEVKQGYLWALREKEAVELLELSQARTMKPVAHVRSGRKSPWDEYVFWAARFYEHPDFDKWERDYKFTITDRLVRAREALLNGSPEWPALLTRAFANPPNNITPWQVHSKLLGWVKSDPEAAGRALSALWSAPRPVPDGVADYRGMVPDSLKPIRRAVIFSFLLMALDPTVFVPYRTSAFSDNYRMVGYPEGPGSGDPVEQYEHALGFADQLMAECAQRRLVLRDRLDAQSIVWTMANSGPLDEWDDESKARFLAYKGEDRESTEDTVSDAESIYEALCSDSVQIRFPEWVVTDYLLSLAAKPFVLLSGISGTGKTQIAQIVAELLAGDEDILEAQPVKRDDPGSAFHTVGKSTLAQGLVIPRNAEHLFPDAEPGKWRVVTIRTEGGEYAANVEQVVFTDPRRAPIMRLMWKKDAKKWIRSAAEFDDVLRITPDPGDEAVFDVEVIKPERIVRRSDARRVALVPVRADWTDNRDLLGFYNVLTERYEPTDLLRVLLRAAWQPDELHFVILDEMNLAKVEYYFADFLSAMETTERGQGIPLHDQDEDVVIELDGEDALVPRRLPIPANVFFTGTVNIDETTHMFSRKVLDRANVIEFHDVDVRRHLGLPGAQANGPKLRLHGDTDVTKMLVRERDRKAERAILAGEHGTRLAAVHDILRDYNLHFGYRVVDECARYLWLTKTHAGHASLDEALDLQILQKVLPKLAGNRSELQKPLERLLSFFVSGNDAELNLGDAESIRAYDLSGARMPMSAAKVCRMLGRLTAVGFTSFVE